MRTETVVLVVEDEVLVRLAAVQMLEDAGFTTLEAENADKAINILETHPDISLVFTDVQMPGTMNGVKLADAVRKRWPPVRLIVTSGLPRPAELDDRLTFLPKPYVWPALETKLREVLGAE